jgi:flagellar biosynthetic protein FliQ
MTPELVADVLRHALTSGAMVMAPILLTGLTVGITVGALQAATQVNEPTLTFVPKVTAVGLVAGFILPWALTRLVSIFDLVVRAIASLGGG